MELNWPALLKGRLTSPTTLLFHSSPADTVVASLALELLQAVGH